MTAQQHIEVNGARRAVAVDEDIPVLWVLRDVMGLTGTKFGCGMGLCGACTIHVDGMPARSCITPVGSLTRARIDTIEQLSRTAVGRALQKAWVDLDVPQCGYCQSGQLMTAASLLARNAAPGDQDIDDAMSGNICRCGSYHRIRQGIKTAARALAEGARGRAK
jgi:isoquinoline 1-oxidoreductase alpha subunit